MSRLEVETLGNMSCNLRKCQGRQGCLCHNNVLTLSLQPQSQPTLMCDQAPPPYSAEPARAAVSCAPTWPPSTRQPAATAGQAVIATQMIALELGNDAAPSTERKGRFDWRLFLRAGAHAKHIAAVHVLLHPTFTERRHVLTTHDSNGTFYTKSINGWGVFEIDVEIEWDRSTISSPARSVLHHQLSFSGPRTSHTISVMVRLMPQPNEAASPPLSAPCVLPQQSMQPTLSRRRKPHIAHMSQRPCIPHMPQKRPCAAAAITDTPGPIEVSASKEADPNHSVIAMVIDRSGSMSSMGPELEGGCNAYLDEQRKTDSDDQTRTSVIIATFDNTVEVLHSNTPLAEVPAITKEDVKPRGMTALYDAIGEALQRTATLVNGLEKAPDVTIFILTDGQENASRTWTKSRINADIARLQAQPTKWDFYFAAANQDAMAEGRQLGMDMDQCMTFGNSSAKMKSAMVHAKSAKYRKKMGVSSGFSREERLDCA